jgi:CPA1 family monovalent cation:H+ antiporter
MLIEHIIAALVFLLLLALIAKPVSKWIHLPYTSVLVLVGFLASEALVFMGVDTGIRADNYQALIFYVFIPVLVFESAYRIDKKLLLKNLFPILFLAIVGMLVTCALTAVGLYYGIAHASGFPWIAALLTGSILAATDPVAVVDKLKELNAPKRLSVLLDGESLMNDATAIVLFGLFLSMATVTTEPLSAGEAVIEFCMVFAGGALLGLVIGYLAGVVGRLFCNVLMTGMLTLIAAYGSFLAAEALHVSGVMSTLLAGIVMSMAGEKQGSSVESDNNEYLWEVISHIANVFVFLVVGAVITLSMFEERWLAMLIAIGAVSLARAVSVYGGLSLIALFQKEPVNAKYQTVMVWGGLRGAVTLALALSLPTSLDYWWTIQSIAFGVVIFSLFIQAPSMRLLVNGLGIRS